MKIRVFRSGKGDALLLTSKDDKHILVDGGVPDAYEDHLARRLGRMRDDGEALEMVCVSHIDRDHIGGILEMMDNEVAWRLYEARQANPALRPRGSARKPKIKRPPEVKAIWHNAFWETVRRRRIRASGARASLEMSDLFQRNALVYAGAGEAELGRNAEGNAILASDLAAHHQFLGQSVGDAVELSRRIGADQLGIDLNPEFGGNFVVRKRGQVAVDVADFKLTVLGPTTSELNTLLPDWNKWLEDHEDYLKDLLRRHDRDADRLDASELEDVIRIAQSSAIALAGNQAVTPPNLASIILLAENDGRRILLTGDADDVSILDGLKAEDLLDANDQILVDAFKLPHHGAHNSYSDALARQVLAHHYIACGNGKHSNPELDVIEGYLTVLLKGKDGHPPALRDGLRPKFWFTSGPDIAEDAKLIKHWEKMEKLLRKWQNRFPGKFRYRFTTSGDSFTVR